MNELARRVLDGEVRGVARAMRQVDDHVPGYIDVLKDVFPHTGKAFVLGVTGNPGAGKSTLCDRLIEAFRSKGSTVGVIAVDPSSPYSGGAILGDRIRMQQHAVDPGVFIRSLATRGNLGGLSRATSDVIRVLDAMGKDVILVETVGVGQDEIDIARLAHTTVVVVVPGMGDDIQAIKAGILEIADVFAVNKADREGSDRTVRELRSMLELRRDTAPGLDHDVFHKMSAEDQKAHAHLVDATGPARGWEPPVVKTIATRDGGMDEFVAALSSHDEHLRQSGELEKREIARARAEFVAILRDNLLKGALAELQQIGTLDDIATRIARREQDPYALSEELTLRLTRGGR